MTDYFDDDPTGDDEVTALWDGRLPMDRVLETLQREIEQHKESERQRAQLFERLSNGSAELDALRERIAKFDDLVAIQVHTGNWDYDPYMHGMANGMLLAQAVIKDEDYKPLSAPVQWLADKSKYGTASTAVIDND